MNYIRARNIFIGSAIFAFLAAVGFGVLRSQHSGRAESFFCAGNETSTTTILSELNFIKGGRSTTTVVCDQTNDVDIVSLLVTYVATTSAPIRITREISLDNIDWYPEPKVTLTTNDRHATFDYSSTSPEHIWALPGQTESSNPDTLVGTGDATGTKEFIFPAINAPRTRFVITAGTTSPQDELEYTDPTTWGYGFVDAKIILKRFGR